MLRLGVGLVGMGIDVRLGNILGILLAALVFVRHCGGGQEGGGLEMV